MSYLVLARKWRPQNFSEVVGQRPVVQTLQNAIKQKRVAHAMLFSGVRGVGKTTLARIMAKAINCLADSDPPCCQCDSCLEIAAGNALDLHEIDGASNRGIEQIRDLKENIRFQPARGRYKIIIIDEVHMLTMEAFNALLKTLEEPPEHVYFIFATTELHKVPVTILSRCQRYELKRVPFAELVTFFAKLAAAEEVEISTKALEMIAREAGGSVRDGLSLLDQIFSFGGQQITDAEVGEVLGLVDSQVFATLAGALLRGDLAASLALLASCYGQGIDLKRFTADLLACFRALMLCKSTPRPEEILELPDQDLAGLKQLAAESRREVLYQYFQLLLKGVEEMQYSAHPRLSLEMTFVKMVQSGQVAPVSELLARLDALLAGEPNPLAPPAPVGRAASGAGGGSPPSPALKVGEPERRPAAPVREETKATTAAVRPPVEYVPAVPEPTPKLEVKEPTAMLAAPPSSLVPDEEGEEEDEHPGSEEVAAPPIRVASVVGGAVALGRVGAAPVGPAEPPLQNQRKEVRRQWDGFIAHVKERKPWMASVLGLGFGDLERDHELVLKFDDAADCRLLQEAENLKTLTELGQDFFQKELRVTISIRGSRAEGEEQAGQAGPQEERRALARDPLVQMAAEIFGGQVTGIRTGARSR